MAIKFKANKFSLLEVVLPCISASSTKNTIPALEGLLLTLEENMLTVCGYNLEWGMTATADVFGISNGSVILNAQKLSSIIKSMPDCDILIEADDKNSVQISGEESNFSIHGIGRESFPNIPGLGGEKSFMITQKTLKSIINSTSFAVSLSETRPILMGELFAISQKKLTVVALDNYRLAMREENTALCNNDEDYKIVVPGKTLSELAKHLNMTDEPVNVEFTDKHIIFNFENIVFFSRLLEGNYIDYTLALPTQNKISVIISRSAFLESVERASLLVDEKLKTPIKCSFKGNTLNVSCTTQYGKVNDNIAIQKEGPDIEIGFNNRYISDALKACSDDNVKLSMSTPIMSMVITGVEKSNESSYLYLVLPFRLKE